MNGKYGFQILALFGILATLLSGAVLILTPQRHAPFDHFEMVASVLGGLVFILVGVGGMLKAPEREKPLGRAKRIAHDVLGLGGLVMLVLGGLKIAETLARPGDFELAIVLYYCIFILYGLFMLSFPVLSRLYSGSAAGTEGMRA